MISTLSRLYFRLFSTKNHHQLCTLVSIFYLSIYILGRKNKNRSIKPVGLTPKTRSHTIAKYRIIEVKYKGDCQADFV